MSKVYTVAELGGPTKCVHYCLPGGIGDISWIYTKWCNFSRMTGWKVLWSVAGKDKPLRGGDLVQLLPEVYWGGYLEDRESWQVHSQCLPTKWPDTMGGFGFLVKPYVQNLSANIHLELGNPLSEWMPMLPINYHYSLGIKPDDQRAAESLIASMSKPTIAVYVSNRDKDNQKNCGWALWDVDTWCKFLNDILHTPGCENASFVFLGAEYDRDKTTAVCNQLGIYMSPATEKRRQLLIGESLGKALWSIAKCNYMFAYPGGLGILANVLRVPSMMMLPWLLKKLETVYADPLDMASGLHKVWADPKPAEVLEWFRKIGGVMSGMVH